MKFKIGDRFIWNHKGIRQDKNDLTLLSVNEDMVYTTGCRYYPEISESSLIDCIREGIWEQVKVPKKLKYRDLQDAIITS